MNTLVRLTSLAALALAIAACSAPKEPERKAADEYQEGDGFSLRKLVGVTKTAPDEFAVITAKPLQMPEDFASLPQPDPGARSALIADPVAEARAALLGEVAPTPASTRISTSEGALLAATGEADPGIRATIEAEKDVLNDDQDQYVLDSVFPSLRTFRGADFKDAIKPEQERERLSELSGGPRSFDPNPVIATIPGPAPAPAQATLPGPATTAASIEPVATRARAPIDPVVGEELIFIPE